MVAYTLYHGYLYAFYYVSPSNDYDQLLPTVKGIINSTEIRGTSKETLASNFATFYSIFIGVNLQVPAEWAYAFNDQQQNKYAIFAPREIAASNSTNGLVRLYTSPNFVVAPFERIPELFNNYLSKKWGNGPLPGDFYMLPAEKTILDGYNWWKFEYSYTDPSEGFIKGIVLITTKDNIIYALNYEAPQDIFEKYYSLEQKIVNSFAFANPVIK